MNLLEETLAVLQEHNISESEILWVGSNDGKIHFNWEVFKKAADEEYDTGFGSQEVASDLVIVGKDFWLTRQEYDGSEWWQLNKKPKKLAGGEVDKVVLIGRRSYWPTLKEINPLE